jgi:hypothetical protein
MLPSEKQRIALLNLDGWAQSWARDESDKVLGAEIVRLLTPFWQHLVSQGLALNTLRRHKGNLYLLGSQVLDSLTQFPEDAVTGADAALDEHLSNCEYEGPPLRDATEAEQHSFDATCRRVYKFQACAGRVQA